MELFYLKHADHEFVNNTLTGNYLRMRFDQYGFPDPAMVGIPIELSAMLFAHELVDSIPALKNMDEYKTYTVKFFIACCIWFGDNLEKNIKDKVCQLYRELGFDSQDTECTIGNVLLTIASMLIDNDTSIIDDLAEEYGVKDFLNVLYHQEVMGLQNIAQTLAEAVDAMMNTPRESVYFFTDETTAFSKYFFTSNNITDLADPEKIFNKIASEDDINTNDFIKSTSEIQLANLVKKYNNPLSVKEMSIQFIDEVIEAHNRNKVPGIKPWSGRYVAPKADGKPINTPHDIYDFLSDGVYGQEEAKKAASLILWKKISGKNSNGNVLFIGPTGCGKTETFRRLSQLYPVYIYDASTITQEGFKGGKKYDTVFKDMISSGMSPQQVEKSIIVFDEFDKLVTPCHSSSGENVSASIQFQMLSMFEGTQIPIGCEKNGEKKDIFIDTSQITFVCLGAFSSLTGIKDEGGSIRIGFDNVKDKKKQKITIEDLIKYGMVPELAGRFSSIVQLSGMSEEDFYKICTAEKPYNPIKRVCEKMCIPATYSPDCIRKMAKMAFETGTGVRYIISAVESSIDQYIFDHERLDNGILIQESEAPELDF